MNDSVFAIGSVSENCQFSYTTGTISTENAYAIAWVVLICGVGMAVPLILIKAAHALIFAAANLEPFLCSFVS